jgi:ribosomal protein S4
VSYYEPNKSYYESNLGDVAEPQYPSERSEANRCQLNDYEGLWLRGALKEYAYYKPEANKEIAMAYHEYIGEKVYEQKETTLYLYAHSDIAVETLIKTLSFYRSETKDVDAMMFKSLERRIDSLL